MKAILYLITLLCASSKQDTLWYSMYLQGNKVGYSSIVLYSKPSGYQIDESNYMQVQMLGTLKRVLINTSYNTDKALRISSAKFDMKSQDQKISGTFKVVGDTIFLSYASGGGTPIERKILVSEPVFTETTLRLYLERNPVKSLKVALLDAPTASVSEGICELISEKSGTRTYRLSYQGTETRLTIKNGSFVREEGPMGISIVRESKEDVVEFAREIDITELYAIVPNKPIRAKDYLKLKLTGSLKGIDVNFGPQKLLDKTQNTIRLEIKAPDIKCSQTSPLSGEVKKYLEPDAYVQSNAPEIIEISEKITSGMKDPCAKIRALNSWLFHNIIKAPSVTVPTALDVLRERRGDCNEHAVLFTALARAAGIPTDIVVGLVYQDGAYYYHAWAMVFIGGEWIFVDPIFGEFPASLKHLALSRGSLEKQTEIMQVVGNLKIDVEEQL